MRAAAYFLQESKLHMGLLSHSRLALSFTCWLKGEMGEQAFSPWPQCRCSKQLLFRVGSQPTVGFQIDSMVSHKFLIKRMRGDCFNFLCQIQQKPLVWKKITEKRIPACDLPPFATHYCFTHRVQFPKQAWLHYDKQLLQSPSFSFFLFIYIYWAYSSRCKMVPCVFVAMFSIFVCSSAFLPVFDQKE